jgi:hypothetical protein
MRQTRARRAPKPVRAGLLRQVGGVLIDLPLFLTAPLYRRWHLHWGATPEEVASALPGDARLPRSQFVCTRAITIDAPAAAVWPWLVQVGCGRGGWYSHDLLDNLARPSAREVLPGLQHLKIGQWVPMAAGEPTETNALRVEAFESGRWLLWSKPDSTWVWTLTDLGGDRTRLVTRVHAVYDWRRPARALLGGMLLEFGDFAMMRRMLRGIKERAESLHSRSTTDVPRVHFRSRRRSRTRPGSCAGDLHRAG